MTNGKVKIVVTTKINPGFWIGQMLAIAGTVRQITTDS
jgi:hypothetical protein